jgi:hypothetical protein
MAPIAIATAVGAVMYWTLTYQGNGFRPSTVGVILVIFGAAGFVAKSVVSGLFSTSMVSGDHTRNCQVIDSHGQANSLHQETTQPMTAIPHAHLKSGRPLSAPMFTPRASPSRISTRNPVDSLHVLTHHTVVSVIASEQKFLRVPGASVSPSNEREETSWL